MAARQRLDHGSLVDYCATGRVDQDCSPLHLGDPISRESRCRTRCLKKSMKAIMAVAPHLEAVNTTPENDR
jgi:hypothetical protein